MFSINLLYMLYLYLFVTHTLCDDITQEVFGNTSNHYLPAAFGDFNADKLTDMFIIENLHNGSYIVKVLLSYSISPFVRPTGPWCQFDINVKSVVPSDFDGDGAMDVLAISLKDGFYECYILWGNLTHLFCPETYESVATLKTQPLLMDYNGDMIADLFGEGLDGNRSFWVFDSHRRKPIQIPMQFETTTLSTLKKSGGHAFVDIDKDLAADLWISTEDHFEIWANEYDFQEYEVIEHPTINEKKVPVIGQSTFMDIDMDGNIEVILPICSDASCEQSFLYIYEFGNATGVWYNLKVNFKDENEVQWSFPSDKASYLYTNTITPRVGDQNFDGYPDILITVFNKNTPQVILLINSKCTAECEYPRTFIPQWKTFNAWTNSVLGAFFDFHEDGNLDVLLVNSSDGQTYSLGAYKDPVGYDAMFLKVLVLTGVCYNDCPHKEIPYGTNLPGPSITYSMTSATGGTQMACATQMSQTGHFALQLPFTIFGLGRNWNFIEKLQVGIPKSRPALGIANESTYNSNSPSSEIVPPSFSQIIPNSQLVVIPYPKDRPSLWITKLFITPSKAMLMTAGALIATCLFVGAIIAALHFREKQQDKHEKRQQAQRFHFDAM